MLRQPSLTTERWWNQVNENYWDLAFQSILGKLYVISLFVTLYAMLSLTVGGKY